MQYNFNYTRENSDLIKKIDKMLDLEDKYGNKRFKSKSQIILHLLRIGFYTFQNETQIKEK